MELRKDVSLTTSGLSVAMITYNGARFISDQLNSVLGQVPSPDEVVVVDDGSVDGSLEAVQAVAAASAGSIRVVQNDRRLGPACNAEKALRMTTKELILLADQDDVWQPGKIQRIKQMFAADRELDLLFTDGEIVDANGQSLGRRLWDAVEFDRRLRSLWTSGLALDVLLRRQVVTGATVALRRRLLDAATPFPPAGWHDAWLALYAVADNRKVLPLHEPLIHYRVHGTNAAGTPTRNPVRRLHEHAEGWQKRQDVLIQQEELHRRLAERMNPSSRAKLERSIAFLRRRQALPTTRARRVWPVLSEAVRGDYRRFARGAVSAVFDLAAPAAPAARQ